MVAAQLDCDIIKVWKGWFPFTGHKNIFVFLTQTIRADWEPALFLCQLGNCLQVVAQHSGSEYIRNVQKRNPMTATKFVKELYNEALVYSSVVFGMGFWIDDQGLFISAPEFKDGSLDIDNAVPVYDWENFDELSAHHLSHLMHVNQMCILKRDSQQLDYYAGVFANV